jgi:hypothetical protein
VNQVTSWVCVYVGKTRVEKPRDIVPVKQLMQVGIFSNFADCISFILTVHHKFAEAFGGKTSFNYPEVYFILYNFCTRCLMFSLLVHVPLHTRTVCTSEHMYVDT